MLFYIIIIFFKCLSLISFLSNNVSFITAPRVKGPAMIRLATRRAVPLALTLTLTLTLITAPREEGPAMTRLATQWTVLGFPTRDAPTVAGRRFVIACVRVRVRDRIASYCVQRKSRSAVRW